MILSFFVWRSFYGKGFYENGNAESKNVIVRRKEEARRSSLRKKPDDADEFAWREAPILLACIPTGCRFEAYWKKLKQYTKWGK